MPFDQANVTTKVLEVLQIARERLTKRWIKGRAKRSIYNRKTKQVESYYCIVGAVGLDHGCVTDELYEATSRAEHRVMDAILADPKLARIYSSIPSFNDDTRTTRHQVLALMDKAIDLEISETLNQQQRSEITGLRL